MRKDKAAVLCCLLLGLIVAWATPAAAQEGNSYEGIVRTSFGTQFVGCLEFSPEAPGQLIVSDLGEPLVWAHTNLNRKKKFWISTPLSGADSGIAFSGKMIGKKGIKGDAVDEEGNTYKFSGKKADCVAALRSQAGNPWLAPADQVSSAQLQVQLLTGDVEDLVGLGFLNPGQGRFLASELEEVLEQLDRGRDVAAMNGLLVFINRVQGAARVRSMALGEDQTGGEDALDLIDSANAIIESILNGG